jgi:hypothetical protein
MILKFINDIQDKILNTYHITINFKTIEKKPSQYRLELLADLRNQLECDFLIQQIQQQISNKFLVITTFNNEVKTNTERTKIESDFKNLLHNHVSMKFLFRENVNDGFGKIIKVIDNSIPVNGVKDYRVNILKSGQIPHNSIEDMFCIEIITDTLK